MPELGKSGLALIGLLGIGLFAYSKRVQASTMDEASAWKPLSHYVETRELPAEYPGYFVRAPEEMQPPAGSSVYNLRFGPGHWENRT